jgi:hypothetical protein
LKQIIIVDTMRWKTYLVSSYRLIRKTTLRLVVASKIGIGTRSESEKESSGSGKRNHDFCLFACLFVCLLAILSTVTLIFCEIRLSLQTKKTATFVLTDWILLIGKCDGRKDTVGLDSQLLGCDGHEVDEVDERLSIDGHASVCRQDAGKILSRPKSPWTTRVPKTRIYGQYAHIFFVSAERTKR